jgi:pSer/pThr/pTyr-binding forkhead associated (FHA) protein
MRARLIPLTGGNPVEIARDVTVVGRTPGLCDLIVDSSSISKLHCVIVRTDGLLFVRDLGSTNGTKVNGQRVLRGALLPGDELAFASIRYRVYLGPGEPVVSPDAQTEFLEPKAALAVADDATAPGHGPSSDSDVQILVEDSDA